MKTIRYLILSLVIGAVLTITATASQAAIYNYSFSSTSGTISGAITLADGNGSFSATSLTIDTAPSIPGFIIPLDFINSSYDIHDNSFVVSEGNIISAEFWAHKDNNHSDFQFNSESFGFFEHEDTAQNFHLVRGPFSISPSVVPLPAALPLYGAGVAVLGFIGWRRKRKATA